jgi:hypothetical protein
MKEICTISIKYKADQIIGKNEMRLIKNDVSFNTVINSLFKYLDENIEENEKLFEILLDCIPMEFIEICLSSKRPSSILENFFFKAIKSVLKDCLNMKKKLTKLNKEIFLDLKSKCDYYEKFCFILSKIIQRKGSILSSSEIRKVSLRYTTFIFNVDKLSGALRAIYHQFDHVNNTPQKIEKLEMLATTDIEFLCLDEKNIKKRKELTVEKSSVPKRKKIRSSNVWIDECVDDFDGEAVKNNQYDDFDELDDFIDLDGL